MVEVRGYRLSRIEAWYAVVMVVNGVGLEYFARHVLVVWKSVLLYIFVLAIQNGIEYITMIPLKRRLMRRVRTFLMLREFEWKQTLPFDKTSREIPFQKYNQQVNSVLNVFMNLFYKAESAVLPMIVSLYFIVQLCWVDPVVLVAPAVGITVFLVSRYLVPELGAVRFSTWDDAWDNFCSARQVFHEDHIHGRARRALQRERQRAETLIDLEERDDITETREYGRFIFCALLTLFALAVCTGPQANSILFIRNFQVVFSMTFALAGVRLQIKKYHREKRNLENIRNEFGDPEEIVPQVTWEEKQSLLIRTLRFHRAGPLSEDLKIDPQEVELVAAPDVVFLDPSTFVPSGSQGTTQLVARSEDSFRLELQSSLTLDRGDRVLLSGASGAGKSTLMDILAGITPSHRYESDVVLVPSTVRVSSFKALTASRVLVSQQTGVNEQDSIYEMVSGYDLEDGESFARAFPCVERALALAHCDAFVRTKNMYEKQPGLSGGEKVRIILARALFRVLETQSPPSLLFLDEIDKSVSEDVIHAIFSDIFNEFPQTTIIAVVHTTSVQQRPDWTVRLVVRDGRIAREVNS